MLLSCIIGSLHHKHTSIFSSATFKNVKSVQKQHGIIWLAIYNLTGNIGIITRTESVWLVAYYSATYFYPVPFSLEQEASLTVLMKVATIVKSQFSIGIQIIVNGAMFQ